MSVIKAIVVREFGGPEVLKLENIAESEPGPGQVLVEIHAAGVNPVDTYIRSGTYAIKPELPYTPGSDVSGIVKSVGKNVTALKPGDRVYSDGVDPGSGAYAQIATWQASHLYPLPDQVSFAQGAALGIPYATAWRALFNRACAKAGETILIHGASGGVGVAAVQLAKAHKLKIIGTAGTDEGRDLIIAQGAHFSLNHNSPDYASELNTLTDGKGVDVVLEMLANVNLDRDLDFLTTHGRVVIIGNRGRTEIDPRKAMVKDAAILGMTLFNTTPDELASIHTDLISGLQTGVLQPVIARELPLADARLAHIHQLEPGAHGKIVLIPM